VPAWRRLLLARACSRRSRNRVLLGRPVRESCSAWWVSCASKTLRSVISRTEESISLLPP
jgi:hypothetical protein